LHHLAYDSIEIIIFYKNKKHNNKLYHVSLSLKDCAAGCIIVLSKSGRLELGDNILLTL